MCLLVAAGHVDLFAVKVVDGKTASARRHLFRVDSGEIILDLPQRFRRLRRVRAGHRRGNVGAEASLLPRPDLHEHSLVAQWIGRLAQVIAGPNPSWEIPDAPGEGTAELKAGERCRGPARRIVWLSVHGGTARVMGREPPYPADSPLFPLTSGLWVEAGPAGCTVGGSVAMPGDADLWRAMDHFHLCAMACIRDRLAQHIELEVAAPGPAERAGDDPQAATVRTPVFGDHAARRPRPCGRRYRKSSGGGLSGGGLRHAGSDRRAAGKSAAHARGRRNRRDRPRVAASCPSNPAARRVVETGCRRAGGLARGGAQSGGAGADLLASLRDGRAEVEDETPRRSIDRHGTRSRGGDVLSGSAVAPLSGSGTCSSSPCGMDAATWDALRSPSWCSGSCPWFRRSSPKSW